MYTYIMRINTFLKQKLLFAYTILEPCCLAMKQDSIYSKLTFEYFRNRYMSVNKLEKLPCIVSIVDISK